MALGPWSPATLITRSGKTRGTVYRLAGTALPDSDVPFGQLPMVLEKGEGHPLSLDLSPKGSESASKGSDLSSEPLGGSGRMVSGLKFPLVDSLDDLDPYLRSTLINIATPVKEKGKVSQSIICSIIADLCKNRYLTMKTLSILLDRDEGYIRQRVMNGLVNQGSIIRAYPQSPNHPRQAYITAEDG